MLKIAVFGAGRIGRIHAQNVVAHPALRLEYLVDPGAHVGALAAQTGAKVVDVHTALGDPDIAGIVVASPTALHLEHCAQALDAGKAVLCEKPVDLDAGRARAASAKLGARDARLLVGFNRRFDPHFSAARSRLMAGDIGKLESLHITSHDPAPPSPAYVRESGGLFKDMAIHDFDMARWLLGEQPTEVLAAASCLIDPGIGAAGDVDTAKTVLKTASGTLCVISNSRRSGYGYDQRIEAFGSTGAIRADNLLQSSVSTWSASGMSSDTFQNFFLDRYADAYRRELEHFVQVIGGRESPAVSFDDGVAALTLAEAAAESLRTGRTVRVS